MKKVRERDDRKKKRKMSGEDQWTKPRGKL